MTGSLRSVPVTHPTHSLFVRYPSPSRRAVWSECTIWVNLTNLVSSNLSVFGMLLASADSDSNHSYFAIQVVSAIPLVRSAAARGSGAGKGTETTLTAFHPS